jgi:uncharacterized protein YegP (UPF0339 family)
MPRPIFASSLLLAALVLGFSSLRSDPVAVAADTKKPAATFEVYKDKAGEFRWRLRALNSQIIATSGEGYTEKRSCMSAIDSVKKAAPDAPIKEESAP